MSTPSRPAAVLHHVRHSRHPLTGWAKWSLIVAQWLIGIVALFAAVNLGLTLAAQPPGRLVERITHETLALAYSTPDGRSAAPDAFKALYGDDLGADPAPEAVRAYFESRAADRSFLLDQVMVDHLTARFGGLDAHTFPPGVYVGGRALGPDDPPWVHATKWPWHFLFFPRHAYILVVPETGAPQVFSASQGRKFDAASDHPDRLRAVIVPYDASAYDYPSSGQAVHELVRVRSDPAGVSDALTRLRAAEARLETDPVRYGVLAPNSNTVVGCILEEAGVMTRRQRQDPFLSLRAPGIGAACR